MDNIFEPLPRSFFEPSASIVAPLLLGHWLVRRTEIGLCGGPIVETEAYVKDDPACHAFIGLTKRNQVMWGKPGIAYVYLIYGFHHCVNVVCRRQGEAEAVLIRAIDPAIGMSIMRKNRAVAEDRHLTSGPGKLCAALQIDRSHDGVDLCDAKSPLFLARNTDVLSFLEERGPTVTTTRIGLTQAADRNLRFYLDGSLSVSRKQKVK